MPEVLPITAQDLDRIHEIDVSEETGAIYLQRGSHLELIVEAHSRPRRSVAEWAGEVSAWQRFVSTGGSAFGAFDRERLIAFSVMRAGLDVATAQLAGLYVDRAWRRKGLGSNLVSAAIDSAAKTGARKLYVSSSRYESSVAFYLKVGFEPLASPNPELLALEPKDIHMSLPIGSTRSSD